MTRPCRAIINLKALSHNLAIAQRLSESARCIAVIKANAYGHGLVEVAQHLSSQVYAFAVASCDEAQKIRDANIKNPILLLEGAFSVADVSYAADNNCWLVLHNHQQLAMLDELAPGRQLRVFVKVDTGMHRLGFAVSDVEKVFADLSARDKIAKPLVIMSHLAAADDLSAQMTAHQLDVIQALQGRFDSELSVANSAAIMRQLLLGQHWSRPGVMLYGGNPFSGAAPDQLQAVMTLQSEVIAIRDVPIDDSVGYGASWTAQRVSRIATVACGYGDGYPRHTASGTPVWVAGKLCPLVGRVSMDMISVDITDHADVAVGSTVELWGEHVSVNEVARAAGTISYELLAGLPERPPRVYLS